jgi:hypothetical protein
MTLAAHPASQPRSLSVPAAPRTTNPMSSRRRHSSSARRAPATTVLPRNRAGPPSSVPTVTLRKTSRLCDEGEPSAILKSP